MVDLSRRNLLLGSGVALGAAAIGAPLLSAPAAFAASYDPTLKTTPIAQFPSPAQYGSLYPVTGTVEQNAYVDARGYFFLTQINTTTGDLYITRLDGPGTSTTHDNELDHMFISGANAHGLGLLVEDPVGYTYIWTTLGEQLARFQYVGGFSGSVSQLANLTYLPRFTNWNGQYQESVYTFDSKYIKAGQTGFVVERMFDFSTGTRERYTRRALSDLRAGIDKPYGQFFAPVGPPTTQGFATMNDTFFRWCGASNADTLGQANTADPMKLEQWSWGTGQLVGSKAYPTLAQTNTTPGQLWKDGRYEPEGATVYRESDGTASLIVGVTVGAPNDHRYPIYKFASVGAAPDANNQ